MSTFPKRSTRRLGLKSAAGVAVMACSSPSAAQPAEIAVGEVASLEASVAAAGTPQALQAFPGEYKFTGGASERQALEAAVDDVVAEMNALARPIARSRLLDANPIASVLSIAADGSTVTVGFDDRRYTAVVGGPAVNVTGVTGDKVALTYRVAGERLVQRFKGPKGARKNAMSVNAKRLRLNVKVTSESLPKDLVYKLTYTRKS